METKPPGSGELLAGASTGCNNKRPPSRLQKQAPASLQLEQGAGAPAPTGSWGDGRTPIPLLSPLVTASSPLPVWEADQAGARKEAASQGGSGCEGSSTAGRHGCNGDGQVDEAAKAPAPAPAESGGVWQHPALPTPLAEPASLAPFFQSQCALEVSNAQQ